MRRTAVALFQHQVERYGERVAFRCLHAGGAPGDLDFTWRDWGETVEQVAAALVTLGHAHGEVAAVLAGNRPIWPIADLAILTAGLVSAGLYPSSAPAQVKQVLADCGARIVFVDTPEQLAKVAVVAADLPRLRTIVVGPGYPQETTQAEWELPNAAAAALAGVGARVVQWSDWLALGASALANPTMRTELRRHSEALQPDDTAILIYTSGSTGTPKGACIPHRYLLASADSVRDALGFDEADTALSFLPFCHAAERIFGLYTRLLCGMECGLVEDVRRVWDAARDYGPTSFGGLPRFYEKVYERLQLERAGASPRERERWERVLEMGRLRSRLLRTGAEVPAGHEQRWRDEGAPLFEKLREHFGGRLRLATSGGAALPIDVAEFLDALGISVLGAYGLTEHLCVAFNRPDRYVFDGVGLPMRGTAIRIANDGEILVRRGDLTFTGYHGRDDETRTAFTSDGEWLLTGDLGTIDSHGFLHVTGRKKELIALSTGKKVAPIPIEAGLLEEPWIAHAMLYGEGQKFVSALICLRRPLVEAWARDNGNGTDRFDVLLTHPEVQARVQSAIDRVNSRLSRTEQIRRQVLLPVEFTLENDELTPTLKLRRSVIAERYRDLLDALYR